MNHKAFDEIITVDAKLLQTNIISFFGETINCWCETHEKSNATRLEEKPLVVDSKRASNFDVKQLITNAKSIWYSMQPILERNH